jgi:hypothetical protein
MALSGEGMDHEDNREDPSVLPAGSCAHSGHDAAFPGKDELSKHLLKSSLSADGLDKDTEKYCEASCRRGSLLKSDAPA